MFFLIVRRGAHRLEAERWVSKMLRLEPGNISLIGSGAHERLGHGNMSLLGSGAAGIGKMCGKIGLRERSVLDHDIFLF